LVDIVLLAKQLHQHTGGAFDITLGTGQVTVNRTDGTLTKSSDTTRIDLSAIAKGYAIDQLAEQLEAAGANDYLIEFGGELRAGAGGTWTVGIEQPDGPGALRRTIELRGQSIATSGTYRLGEHIIDPRTGQPSSAEVVSVSVIASTAAEADALATALAVTGMPLGSASIVFADGEILESGLFDPNAKRSPTPVP
jgi:thiamine biosynthesis lipoprotein